MNEQEIRFAMLTISNRFKRISRRIYSWGISAGLLFIGMFGGSFLKKNILVMEISVALLVGTGVIALIVYGIVGRKTNKQLIPLRNQLQMIYNEQSGIVVDADQARDDNLLT